MLTLFLPSPGPAHLAHMDWPALVPVLPTAHTTFKLYGWPECIRPLTQALVLLLCASPPHPGACVVGMAALGPAVWAVLSWAWPLLYLGPVVLAMGVLLGGGVRGTEE